MPISLLTGRRARSASRTRARRRPYVENLESRTLLTAGALDTSFGGTGQVETAPSPIFDARSVVVQPDLKTVVGGFQFNSKLNNLSVYSTALVRYNADGSLDTSFGHGGFASIPTTTMNLFGGQVALQQDGKLVVATTTSTYVTTPGTRKSPPTTTITGTHLEVFRLNPDGSLDTTFGNGGEAVITVPSGNDEATSIAVLASGQIVVAGAANPLLGGPEFTVVRLTSSGALDPTFGPNGQGYNDLGVIPPNSPLSSSFVYAMAVDSSGDVLLGGQWYVPSTRTRTARVVRYTPGGLLDPTFANQGILDMSGPLATISGVDGIAFQPGGRILLSGYISGAGGGVLALHSDGSIDTTFGTNGTFSDPSLGVGAHNIPITAQPDGKILLTASDPHSNVMPILRLTSDGAPDPTFGVGGNVLVTPAGGITAGSPEGLVLGPDGKITTAWLNSPGTSTPVIGTVRLLNDISSNTTMTVAVATAPTAVMALTPDLIASALDSPDLRHALHPLSKRWGAK